MKKSLVRSIFETKRATPSLRILLREAGEDPNSWKAVVSDIKEMGRKIDGASKKMSVAGFTELSTVIGTAALAIKKLSDKQLDETDVKKVICARVLAASASNFLRALEVLLAEKGAEAKTKSSLADIIGDKKDIASLIGVNFVPSREVMPALMKSNSDLAGMLRGGTGYELDPWDEDDEDKETAYTKTRQYESRRDHSGRGVLNESDTHDVTLDELVGESPTTLQQVAKMASMVTNMGDITRKIVSDMQNVTWADYKSKLTGVADDISPIATGTAETTPKPQEAPSEPTQVRPPPMSLDPDEPDTKTPPKGDKKVTKAPTGGETTLKSILFQKNTSKRKTGTKGKFSGEDAKRKKIDQAVKNLSKVWDEYSDKENTKFPSKQQRDIVAKFKDMKDALADVKTEGKVRDEDLIIERWQLLAGIK
jgi:hypothetical protein